MKRHSYTQLSTHLTRKKDLGSTVLKCYLHATIAFLLKSPSCLSYEHTSFSLPQLVEQVTKQTGKSDLVMSVCRLDGHLHLHIKQHHVPKCLSVNIAGNTLSVHDM